MRAVMGGTGRYWAGVLAAAAICGTAPDRLLPPVTAQSREVLLATTTSTRDAGLLDSLIPVFERTSGYRVKVIAVGSGQALEMGRRGDADVVLAHAPEAERVLVDSGYFVSRRLVMHNDFLIVGPAADPAHLGGMTDALAALRRLAEGRAPFVSRGDQSGTHKLEQKLWRLAGIRPRGAGDAGTDRRVRQVPLWPESVHPGRGEGGQLVRHSVLGSGQSWERALTRRGDPPSNLVSSPGTLLEPPLAHGVRDT